MREISTLSNQCLPFWPQKPYKLLGFDGETILTILSFMSKSHFPGTSSIGGEMTFIVGSRRWAAALA